MVAWLIIFLTASGTGQAWPAPGVTVKGGWRIRVNDTQLTAGAGSRIRNCVNFGTAALSVSGADRPDQAWRMDVRLGTTGLPRGMAVHIRRLSGGEGALNGGTAFMRLTQDRTPFFSGRGNIPHILLELRLDGVSHRIQPDTYALDIVYTITPVFAGGN